MHSRVEDRRISGRALTRGHAFAEFEGVADVLEQQVSSGGEGGGAVAAYVDGTKVIDLWWGSADGRPWESDSLVTVMSCTKGAVAVCAQILYDRGLLDVEAPVAMYWPEFATNGKGATLVRHLLDHTAGVLTFRHYWKVVGRDGLGLADWDLMTVGLAGASPSWEAGSRCMYHAHAFGYLVGEVIRRIDGRTAGRFFAEEVAEPLGLDFYIGVPKSILPRVTATLPCVPIESHTLPLPRRQALQEVRRELAAARGAVRKGDVLSELALPWSSLFRSPDLELEPALGWIDIVSLANSPVIRTAEVPSAFGVTTARDLARMFAALACGGELDGVRLVSSEAIALFTSRERLSIDGMTFALGFHRLPPAITVRGASASAFGHGGGGGHLSFADPERRLSFGFVQNQWAGDFSTAANVAAAIYECL